MRKLICMFVFAGLCSPLALAKAAPQAKLEKKEKVDCAKVHETLEEEQYKFHDTLSQMMNDLRESSTPDTELNQEKIQAHLKKLLENKNKMNTVTKDKKFGSCFY